jgi:hypothetical protein
LTRKLPVALAATLCLTISLAAPLSTAEPAPLVAHYVLASGLPGGVIHFGLVCAGSDALLADTNVGGVCFRGVAPGNHTITVVDELGSAPGFWIAALHEGGPACVFETYATGSVDVFLPEGCSRLDVTPVAGSAAGTIRVA